MSEQDKPSKPLKAKPSDKDKTPPGQKTDEQDKGQAQKQTRIQKKGKVRPQKKRAGGTPSKHRRKTRSSGNFLGVLVFLLALGAFAAAGYVMVERGPVTIGGTTIDIKQLIDKLTGQGDAGQSAQPQSKDKDDTRQSLKTKQSQKQQDRWYEKQFNPSALPNEFTGRYVSNFGPKQFELYLNNGVYQLIYSRSGTNERLYSLGRYGYKNGVLALRPDPSMGAPRNPGNEYEYEPMTTETFTVGLTKQNQIIFWDPAAKYINAETSRVVKHPAFHMVDANRLIWKPLQGQ